MIKWCCQLGAVIGAVAILLLSAAPSMAASGTAAPAGVDLSGYWKLNSALSDDAEQLLQQRLQEERKARERWLRQEGLSDPLGIPPIDAPPVSEAAPVAATPARPQQRPRNRRNDELRRMLNISDTLTITQSGARMDIASQFDSRRFEAGSKSQVSMPQGELADMKVSWDGPWFIIERRAKRGPRVTEKYRWLRKTDQLESLIHWSGDSPLEGIKVHRIYDRMLTAPPPPDPDSGPVR